MKKSRLTCFVLLLASLLVVCPAQGQKVKQELEIINPIFKTDTLVQGDTAMAVFTLKNVGSRPLRIKKVLTTCSCSVPQFSKNDILPGEMSKIVVVFNSAKIEGSFSKQLTFLHSGNRGGGHLFIQGFVKKKNLK